MILILIGNIILRHKFNTWKKKGLRIEIILALVNAKGSKMQFTLTVSCNVNVDRQSNMTIWLNCICCLCKMVNAVNILHVHVLILKVQLVALLLVVHERNINCIFEV